MYKRMAYYTRMPNWPHHIKSHKAKMLSKDQQVHDIMQKIAHEHQHTITHPSPWAYAIPLYMSAISKVVHIHNKKIYITN